MLLQRVHVACATLTLIACGHGEPARPSRGTTQTATAPANEVSPSPAAPAAVEGGSKGPSNEFVLRKTEPGPPEAAEKKAKAGKLTPTATEAAIRFTVVDKDKGPVKGIVISLTSPDGKKFYTDETDGDGYTEVLVPVGQKYDLVFLSLGRRDIAANVNVTNEPRQSIKLTLRYKRQVFEPVANANANGAPRFVLNGVTFDTGKASIRPESFARLDSVVEFMTYKKSARVEISGHTDNVGNPKVNKSLSEKRAQACRDYVVGKGIAARRIDAIGYGDERPIAPNDSEEGRQKNRRIEATEL